LIDEAERPPACAPRRSSAVGVRAPGRHAVASRLAAGLLAAAACGGGGPEEDAAASTTASDGSNAKAFSFVREL
jgi:hypothetical protein